MPISGDSKKEIGAYLARKMQQLPKEQRDQLASNPSILFDVIIDNFDELKDHIAVCAFNEAQEVLEKKAQALQLKSMLNNDTALQAEFDAL